MAEEKRPVTLITGASSGIGRALAHEFASHGHELVLVARREQALTAVADTIAANGMRRPTILRLDLGRVDAARDLSDTLAQRALEPKYSSTMQGSPRSERQTGLIAQNNSRCLI